MLKNITITLDPEVARWARIQAAEQDTSVSKLISNLLEREMHASDKYWHACKEWKKRDRDLGVSIETSRRFTREEAHER